MGAKCVTPLTPDPEGRDETISPPIKPQALPIWLDSCSTDASASCQRVSRGSSHNSRPQARFTQRQTERSRKRRRSAIASLIGSRASTVLGPQVERRTRYGHLWSIGDP